MVGNLALRQGPVWRFLSRRLAPPILLIATLITLYSAGLIQDREGGLLRGVAFAMSLLVVIGAHALGHYVVARRSGVEVSWPYFIPQLGIAGTSGAFVRMGWPIENRRAMIRIFAAGPVSSCLAGALVLAVGCALSEIIPRSAAEGFRLGDSLLTLALQQVIFPGMTDQEEILLHPIGVAGFRQSSGIAQPGDSAFKQA